MYKLLPCGHQVVLMPVEYNPPYDHDPHSTKCMQSMLRIFSLIAWEATHLPCLQWMDSTESCGMLFVFIWFVVLKLRFCLDREAFSYQPPTCVRQLFVYIHLNPKERNFKRVLRVSGMRDQDKITADRFKRNIRAPKRPYLSYTAKNISTRHSSSSTTINFARN